VIAFCCTFFQVFNIPVFWPILVMYFITLFCITMKRQIKVLILFNSGSGFKKELIASRDSLGCIAAHDQIPLPSVHMGQA